MLPRSIPCEECGENAAVRGYGRVEYDWNTADGNDESTISGGSDATTLTIRSVRLTIDCPNCGLQVQDHYPAGSDQHADLTQPKKPRPATHTFASLLARMAPPTLPEIPR